jgi:hypothetical protein
MFASSVGDIAAVGSVVVAAAALFLAIRADAHSRRASTAADRAADEAKRSSDAAEAVATVEVERHQRELKSLASERAARELESRSARLHLWTERTEDPHRSFASPDEGFLYYLCVRNDGASKARSLVISNLACNGPVNSMPAMAEHRLLTPFEALIPNRGLRIPLRSVGPQSSFDIAECMVGWDDDAGHHEVRIQVDRRW